MRQCVPFVGYRDVSLARLGQLIGCPILDIGRLSFAKIRRDLVSGEKSPRDVDQDSTFGCAECGMTKELDAEKDGQGGWRESRSRQRP